MPKPGSMPAFFSAFAFRESVSFFSALCVAASSFTSSWGANFAPLGVSSLSRSTVAQMVTFSPRIVKTPGSFTSLISHLGTAGSDAASGLRAAIRSEHSVRTRFAVRVNTNRLWESEVWAHRTGHKNGECLCILFHHAAEHQPSLPCVSSKPPS